MRAVALLLFVMVSLQGCFPVVAVGVGAGVMVAHDRRSGDVLVEDKQIEAAASDQIEQQFNSVMHVNVTSYNHSVLICGEVQDEATKTEIGKMVSAIKNVREVNNELEISGTSSLASRSNDGLITSNVKLRFVNDKRFNADHIKVVTESGTVYLLGLVNHAEADAATDVASTTQGVQSVVRMFEYLN